MYIICAASHQAMLLKNHLRSSLQTNQIAATLAGESRVCTTWFLETRGHQSDLGPMQFSPVGEFFRCFALMIQFYLLAQLGVEGAQA